MTFIQFASFAVLFTLAAFIPSGESIRCWVCSSDLDSRCGDPFNTTQSRYLVTDCDRGRSNTPYLQTNAMCKKVKQTVNGETITVRACTWDSNNDEPGPCSPSSAHPNTKIEYCSTCTTDECNAAPELRHTTFLVLIGAISAAMMLRT